MKKNKDKNPLFNIPKIGRRRFLQHTTAAVTGIGLAGTFSFVKACSSPADTLFTLGVASGDPLPDGVVLWTRLAPKPLEGNGGMASEPVDVEWEVATDEDFKSIVKKGIANAEPHFAHSVHVEVDGLEPAQRYYYRFKTNDQVSPTGRTKTAPAPGADIDQLNFAFASCQSYLAGYYTAYDHMVKDDLDVVFFLGDYIYEMGTRKNAIRQHSPAKEITSLEDYRIRYSLYKTDPSLQAAHAAFPWIVAPDDHEIKNNWGGEGPPYEDNEAFLKRRAAAFQAYYEHMPLRSSSLPENIDMQLYRKFSFGKLANFMVLDTRQYRTNFACNNHVDGNCPSPFDPTRTMLGDQQEKWLFNNLENSSAQWNVLAQQVRIAEVGRTRGSEKTYGMDSWDGYVATRDRLFDVIRDKKVDNFIVLTGDSHQNWVNHLLEDFKDPGSAILGTEFMGTSITSKGDGGEISENAKKVMMENPHVKFSNDQRGYVKCTVTPQELKAEYKVVPYVSKRGAPIHTRATFVVKNGIAGTEEV